MDPPKFAIKYYYFKKNQSYMKWWSNLRIEYYEIVASITSQFTMYLFDFPYKIINVQNGKKIIIIIK